MPRVWEGIPVTLAGGVMKVVSLAGEFGTRISESHLKPKPMIEIGERPKIMEKKLCRFSPMNYLMFKAAGSAQDQKFGNTSLFLKMQ